LIELAEIFIESMMPSFDTRGDEMLCGGWFGGCRKKLIHSVGVTGKVKFIAADSEFDGLFKGADNGLIRFSSAVAPKKGSQPLAPGLALKFLRDG